MEALYEIVYRYVLLQICNSSYMDREVCGGLDPDGTVDSVVVGLFFIYAGFIIRSRTWPLTRSRFLEPMPI